MAADGEKLPPVIGELQLSIDEFAARLDEARQKLTDFTSTPTEATLDADSAPFDARVDDAEGRLAGLDADVADPTIDANSDLFDEHVARAEAAIAALDAEGADPSFGADSTVFDEKMDSARERALTFGAQTFEPHLDLDDDALEAKYLEVNEKLRSLTDRIYDVKISANDTAAKAKLDALIARSDALNQSVGSVRFDTDAGAVRGQIQSLDGDIRKLGADYDKFSNDFVNNNKKNSSSLKAVRGSADDVTGGIGLLMKTAIGLGPALVPIIGVLGAGLTAMVPLVTGVAAGFSGIALVATPALKLVAADANDTAAQIRKLPEPLRDAVTAWKNFDTAYQHWAAGFQPQIFSIMESGLRTAAGAFKDFTPLISGSLAAVQELGGEVAQFSPQFQTFVGFLTREAPDAILALGNVVTNIALGFAGWVEAMAPLASTVSDGLIEMSAEYARWGQTLASNHQFQDFVAYVEREAPVVRQFFDYIGAGFVDLVKAAAPVGDALLKAFNGLAGGLGAGGTGSALSSIGASIGKLVTDATPVVKILGQDLGQALTRLAADIQPLLPALDQLFTNLEPLAKVLGAGFASGFLQVFENLAPALLTVANNIAILLDHVTIAHPGLVTFFAELAGGAYAANLLLGPLGGIASIARDLPKLGELFAGVEGASAAGGLGTLAATLGNVARSLHLIGANGAEAAAGEDAAAGSAVGLDAALDANPIGAVVLALAGLGAGMYELVENFQAVSDFLNGPWGTAISGALAAVFPIVGLPMIIIGHWRGVASFFQEVWDGAKTAFGTAKDVVSDVASFLEGVPNDITTAWTGIVSFFDGIGSSIGTGVSSGLSAVAGFFTKLPARLLSALARLPGLLEQGAEDAIAGFVVGLAYAGIGIWDFFTKLVPKTIKLLGSLASELKKLGTDAITAMLSGIGTAATGVWSFFEKMPGKIGNFLAGLPDDLRKTGTTAMTAMWSAITAAAADIWSFYNGMPNKIKGLLSGLAGDLGTIGTNIMHSMHSGITTAASDIWGFFSGMPDKVKHAFDGAGGWLIKAGEAIMRGLLQGIKDGLGGVESFLKGVGGKITSWKGPPATDAVLLVENGQLIMKGFLAGIESQMGALKATLGEITSSIGGEFSVGTPALLRPAASSGGSGTLVLQMQPAPIYLDGQKIGQQTAQTVRTTLNRGKGRQTGNIFGGNAGRRNPGG